MAIALLFGELFKTCTSRCLHDGFVWLSHQADYKWIMFMRENVDMMKYGHLD